MPEPSLIGNLAGWAGFAVIMFGQWLIHFRRVSPNGSLYLATQAVGFIGNATCLVIAQAYPPLVMSAAFLLMVFSGWWKHLPTPRI